MCFYIVNKKVVFVGFYETLLLQMMRLYVLNTQDHSFEDNSGVYFWRRNAHPQMGLRQM